MSKFTLSLNSHSLSDFQSCESKYLFTHIIGIEPLVKKPALKKGSLFGRYLNLYYYNRIRFSRFREKVLGNSLFWTHKISTEMQIPQSQAFDIFSAMIGYGIKYKSETWKPVAVEKGFSKILYEDDENFITYEGSIDLIISENGKLKPVDHKTESAKRPIYQFNNQALGYCWATGSTEFVYNYITLTKVPDYHRIAHPYSQTQIDNWKSRTIDWAFRVKASLLEKSFLESGQCNGIYGLCPFHLICEAPNDGVKKFIIGANYKQRKVWRSW